MQNSVQKLIGFSFVRFPKEMKMDWYKSGTEHKNLWLS